MELHVFLICQPCVKRARHELPSEDEYRSTLQAATEALEAIELLLQKSPPPEFCTAHLDQVSAQPSPSPGSPP